jgi:hypothetical protein
MCRIETQFAQPSLVAALRLLLAAALAESRNSVFVSISEACVPLYHPAFVWAQLMSEAHVSRVMFEPMQWLRWHSKMATGVLSFPLARKSSQWMSLSRAHATLAAYEQHVWPQFEAYCQTSHEPYIKSRRACCLTCPDQLTTSRS